MVWKPGQTGNPKGRPTRGNSISERVAAATRNGQRPLKLLDSVCRGYVTIQRVNPETKEREEIILRPKVSEMIQAAELLLAYQWGKPVTSIDLQSTVTHIEASPLRQYTLAELQAMLAQADAIEGAVMPALSAGDDAEGEDTDEAG